MSIRKTWFVWAPAGVCLLAALPTLSAQTTGPQSRPVPKPGLVLPITVGRPTTNPATNPAVSVECRVPFGPPVPISAVAFSPDGNTLAVGGYAEVLVWDLAQATLARRLGEGQLNGPVHALAFLDKGRSLAIGDGLAGESGAVRLFRVDSGELTATFSEPNDAIYSLAVSPNEKFLAAGGADTVVRIWGLDTRKLVMEIKDHADCVLSVAFSPDSNSLATAGADKTCRVWDVGSWKEVSNCREAEAVHGTAFSPDGMTVAAAVGGPGEWAIRVRRKEETKSRPTYTFGSMPLSVAWSPKGNKVYAPCGDKTVKALAPGNNRALATFRGHTDWVYTAAPSPDGGRLATGSADGTVKLWNEADGRLLATLVQFHPRRPDWLILTAMGYLTTSSGGELQWASRGLTSEPENWTAFFENAEAVRKVLAGKDVPPPALK